jgi:hypothetical protein
MVPGKNAGSNADEIEVRTFNLAYLAHIVNKIIFNQHIYLGTDRQMIS